MSINAPFDEMEPSSYCLIKITSTKSRGAMIPIAAEGVTVRQTAMSCTWGRQGSGHEARINVTSFTKQIHSKLRLLILCLLISDEMIKFSWFQCSNVDWIQHTRVKYIYTDVQMTSCLVWVVMRSPCLLFT